jgi:hypothetical protein
MTCYRSIAITCSPQCSRNDNKVVKAYKEPEERGKVGSESRANIIAVMTMTSKLGHVSYHTQCHNHAKKGVILVMSSCHLS